MHGHECVGASAWWVGASAWVSVHGGWVSGPECVGVAAPESLRENSAAGLGGTEWVRECVGGKSPLPGGALGGGAELEGFGVVIRFQKPIIFLVREGGSGCVRVGVGACVRVCR